MAQDRCVKVAERFKLEGLLGNNKQEEGFEQSESDNNHPMQEAKTQQSHNENIIVHNNIDLGEISEVDQQIQEHIEKVSDGTYTCKICGKSSVKKMSNIKNHIETHMEGLSFDCKHCGNVFRSRNALAKHIHYQHKSHQ